MLKTITAAPLLALTVVLAGCNTTGQYVEPETPIAQIQDISITGQASYRERIALAPGSTYEAKLLDVSRADAPSVTIASSTKVLTDEQVPLNFAFTVKEHKLKTNMRYVVRVTIKDPAGNLAWTTDTAYPVDPAVRQQDLGTLELVRVNTGVAKRTLVGPTRNVEMIAGRPTIDRSNAQIMFSANGTISGATGCNNFSGSFTAQGNNLELSQLAMTRKACVPALNDQEQRFMSVIQDVSSWSFDADGRLVLSTADGRTMLATDS